MRIGGVISSALVACALALSTIASPALAADGPVMSDFRRFCVATGGDAAKVAALAKQAGWVEVPASAFGEEDGDVEIDTAYMSTDGGLKLLAVMRGEVQPGIHGSGCMLAVEPSRAVGLAEEAGALARVKPHKEIARDDGVIYMYSDTASGRRDLSTMAEDDIVKLAGTAPVQGVFVAELDEMVMIGLVDIVPK